MVLRRLFTSIRAGLGRSGRDLAADRRGAVMVEYLALVAFIGLPIAIALTALAPRLSAHYQADRTLLARPIP